MLSDDEEEKQFEDIDLDNISEEDNSDLSSTKNKLNGLLSNFINEDENDDDYDENEMSKLIKN